MITYFSSVFKDITIVGHFTQEWFYSLSHEELTEQEQTQHCSAETVWKHHYRNTITTGDLLCILIHFQALTVFNRTLKRKLRFSQSKNIFLNITSLM